MIGTYKILTDGNGELFINPHNIKEVNINYSATPINLDDVAIEYIRQKCIVTIYFDNDSQIKTTEKELMKLVEYMRSAGMLDYMSI